MRLIHFACRPNSPVVTDSSKRKFCSKRILNCRAAWLWCCGVLIILNLTARRSLRPWPSWVRSRDLTVLAAYLGRISFR